MHQFLFKAKFSSSLHNFILEAQPAYRQLTWWMRDRQLYSGLLMSLPSGSLVDCIYTAIILEILLLNEASFLLPREITSNMNFLLWPRNLVLWSTLTPQNPFPLIQKYQLRILTLNLPRTSPRNSTWEMNQKTWDENQILWTQKNLEFFLGICMNTSSVLGFYSFLLQRTMTWVFLYVLFHVLGNWENNNKVQGSLPSLSTNSYCPIISLVHFHVCEGLVCQENSTWSNLWLKHKNENDNCLWQWM